MATLFEVGEVAFHNFKICSARTAPIAVTTEAIASLTSIPNFTEEDIDDESADGNKMDNYWITMTLTIR